MLTEQSRKHPRLEVAGEEAHTSLPVSPWSIWNVCLFVLVLLHTHIHVHYNIGSNACGITVRSGLLGSPLTRGIHRLPPPSLPYSQRWPETLPLLRRLKSLPAKLKQSFTLSASPHVLRVSTSAVQRQCRHYTDIP